MLITLLMSKPGACTVRLLSCDVAHERSRMHFKLLYRGEGIFHYLMSSSDDSTPNKAIKSLQHSYVPSTFYAN